MLFGVKAVVSVQNGVDKMKNYNFIKAHRGKHTRPFLFRYSNFKPWQMTLRTGMKSLVHVLSYEPRKIYIFGMDFYQHPKRGFEGYYSSLDKYEPSNKHGDSPYHNSRYEIKYFIKLMKIYPNTIVIDNHTRRTLRVLES